MSLSKPDRRQQLRAAPPTKRGSKIIQVTLNTKDYRKLYDMAAVRGTSISNLVRTLIQEKEHTNV